MAHHLDRDLGLRAGEHLGQVLHQLVHLLAATDVLEERVEAGDERVHHLVVRGLGEAETALDDDRDDDAVGGERVLAADLRVVLADPEGGFGPDLGLDELLAQLFA